MTAVLAHLTLATLGVSVLIGVAPALRLLSPKDPVLRVRLLNWILGAALLVLPLQLVATIWLPTNLRAATPLSVEELTRVSRHSSPIASSSATRGPTRSDVVSDGVADARAASPGGATAVAPRLDVAKATSPAAADVSPAAVLAVAFFAGCLAVIARTAIGLWRVRRFIQQSTALADVGLCAALEDARRTAGLSRPVALRESSDLHAPASWAIGRACILLPPGAAALERETLRCILLHELAHIRRHDSWLALLRAALCAAYWFNPLVWAYARTCNRETELACDALVVRATRRPQTYARCLLDFCHDRAPRHPAAGIALLASFGAAPLERRLLMLSHPNETSRGRARAACGAAFVAICAALTLQAALAAGGAADDAQKQEQRAGDNDAAPPIDLRLETDAVTRQRRALIGALDIPRRPVSHADFDRQLRALGYAQGADGRRLEALRAGGSITDQETIASFTNARKSGTAFIVKDAILSLPEGSHLTAEFEGPKISLSADGRTTTLSLGGGVLRVRDQDNVVRITVHSQVAGDSPVALQAALTVENDEVILRLSPAVRDDAGASIRIEFDLQTGVSADEKDPPSGSIRYKLLEPGDREDAAYRLKMQWRYELADEAKPANRFRGNPTTAR